MLWFLAFLAFAALANSSPIDEKIVGGKEAADGQFPHQVSLRQYGSHFCGGSILNKRWILTAAHCLYGMSGQITAVTGTNTLNSGGDSYKVSFSIYHPEYSPRTLTNDIGLVKVSSDIKFNDKVKTISIFSGEVSEGAQLTLSGWGLTSYPGNIPNKLQFADLTWLNNAECAKKIAVLGIKVGEKQVCTFTHVGQGGCKGDSGGPLIYNGEQIGVVSFGLPCARGLPDVYTRASSFMDWIESTMDSN